MVGILSLFGQNQGNSIVQFLSLLLIIVFIFIGPRMYLWQAMAKIEASALKLEAIAQNGQRAVFSAAGKKGGNSKEVRKKIQRFMDFFMIPPVDIDPFGIMKKLEHLIRGTENRFRQVAAEIAPKANSEEVMDIYMGLQAAVTINMIAKIVRHYAELMKKFKNLQLAMIVQMQLPMIEKIVEAEQKGLNAFLKGEAIGDAAGPLVIASLLDKEGKEIAQDVLASTKEKWGRKITFMKARGPGGRLGELGYAVENITKKDRKVAKIITIDAAQKLEGEKTGSVSEGIGVAIGGAGVERAKIEEIATAKKIPLDAIAIKMSPFEAISPMPAEVVSAVQNAVSLLKERVEGTKKGSRIIVVGVGNTCGIPNTNKNFRQLTKKIKDRAHKLKKEEEGESSWFLPQKGGGKESGMGEGLISNFANFIFVRFQNIF